MAIKDQKTINRFFTDDHSHTMKTVMTRNNGGYDMLDYCDVPMPTAGPDEVLIQVTMCYSPGLLVVWAPSPCN